MEDSTQLPDLCLRLKGGGDPISLQIRYNMLIGSPIVGDTINDLETGRRFEVIGREWQSGTTAKCRLAVYLREIGPEPSQPVP